MTRWFDSNIIPDGMIRSAVEQRLHCRIQKRYPVFCWGVVYSGISTMSFDLIRLGSIPDASASYIQRR